MVNGTALAVWVSSCDECGTCYTLPGLPIHNYIQGQPILRPDKFDKQALPCFCGHTFLTDRDKLSYVLLGFLIIHRIAANEFRLERDFAGVKTDLGQMTDIELEGYLRTRTLLGILPAQVLSQLESQKEISIQIQVTVVRMALAAKG